jgi:capsular exopolysaccharide synthesis family protein
VLEAAAREVPGTTIDSIANAVSSSVDPNANIIHVTAGDRSPARAAAIANAVSRSLLDVQAAAQGSGLASARAKLELQLRQLVSSGAQATEIQAIRDRISELTIAQATIGSGLRLAQPAQVPSAAFSPRPTRNGVIAFFAAMFLGILIVIARDLLRPRIAGSRELSELMGLPVLASIPYTRRRFGRRRTLVRAAADEAYQTLQASVRHALGPEGGTVLITSALEGEGKTTTAVGLARALARVGSKTLLLCADFRLPTLHEHFAVPTSPGLSDLLESAGESPSPEVIARELRSVAWSASGVGAGELSVVTSGSPVENPAGLLFGGPLDSLLSALKALDFDYVVIDGPPILAVADGHALAQRADGVIVVARLGRLGFEQAIETGERLAQLDAKALGLVAGVRSSGHSYAYAHPYWTGRPRSERMAVVRGHENGGEPVRNTPTSVADRRFRA